MADNFERKKVVVVGGGAAGLMSAIFAAQNGASVCLFERNSRTGNKLNITGKGRCNLTNDCDNQEFLKSVPTNPRFLYAALNRFSTSDTKEFFEGIGVPLKTERGKRVFPVSDKASDVSSALERKCKQLGVEIINRRVSEVVSSSGSVTGIRVGNSFFSADSVIVATGGKSYPRTGSDGDGYKFAEKLGHTIVLPRPSLVPIVCEGSICRDLQGLSLKNVSLRITSRDKGKTVYEDFGEMMFTHFGITGPMVLSASAWLDTVEKGKYEVSIDLKPALDAKMLDTRILSDFSENKNRNFENAFSALLPQKLIPVIVRLSGIDPEKKVNSVTKEERSALVTLLKNFKVYPVGLRPIDEAIVTRGGVSTKEINPKTMESKLVKGLYFAGETIDVDAYTGGFNLQIAFSTAVLAGENASY